MLAGVFSMRQAGQETSIAKPNAHIQIIKTKQKNKPICLNMSPKLSG